MSQWRVNIQKGGRHTAKTGGQYVDRDILIDVPDGSAAVSSGQKITVTPKLTYDSDSGRIVASVTGSGTVGGTASAGWVSEVQPAAVSVEGAVSAEPREVLPIMTDAQFRAYIGI